MTTSAALPRHSSRISPSKGRALPLAVLAPRAARRGAAKRPPAPLQKTAVVITRPAGNGLALKRRVQALGGVPVGLPGLALRATDDTAAARRALATIKKAHFVVFTSPAAVRYAFALQPGLRIAKRIRVAAIGKATARALQKRGLPEVLTPPAHFASEGLLALPEFEELRGRRVLLVTAPGGRGLLEEALTARGARVARAEVYRRAAPRITRSHLQALAKAPSKLLTLISSGEALAHLARILEPQTLARLRRGRLIVSSTRLAEAARELGFGRIEVAASATDKDLLAAVLA